MFISYLFIHFQEQLVCNILKINARARCYRNYNMNLLRKHKGSEFWQASFFPRKSVFRLRKQGSDFWQATFFPNAEYTPKDCCSMSPPSSAYRLMLLFTCCCWPIRECVYANLLGEFFVEKWMYETQFPCRGIKRYLGIGYGGESICILSTFPFIFFFF